MSKSTDIRPKAAALYFLPVETRVPLKFGTETLTSVTCARVRLRIEDANGRSAEGWGETPLSVQWVWPSTLSCEMRHKALKNFTERLVKEWATFDCAGHPMEVGHAFIEGRLHELLSAFNKERGGDPMPWLAALVCCSAFDIALHDAFGQMHNLYIYDGYTSDLMSADLAHFLDAHSDTDLDFTGYYPEHFLVRPRPDHMPAWHLVGGKDWLDESERDGSEPHDGYPVLLRDWIHTDGLKCLKVKLRGNDGDWDYDRLVRVGRIAMEENVDWLSADFNSTVSEPGYVNGILDQLLREYPRIYGMILYVEQPFPYELEEHRIDVHSVSARKPLFMDESAHDWRLVRLGRELGWTGVALKTCKTQTGAILALCWAKAHGMTLMVQDLTNPMLAQVPHCLLAAHAGTIMGVETNAMQFYPEASQPEAMIHPGIYQRRNGQVDLSGIKGPGFAYGDLTAARKLPEPAQQWG